MKTLKEQEAADEKSLASLKENLAGKEEDLLNENESLKESTKDKESIEDYLLKIKPGCDFIDEHFSERENSRATEKSALENASKMIKDTPAYKTAMANAKTESFGKCKDTCTENENHANCKACMADVTVPAYC